MKKSLLSLITFITLSILISLFTISAQAATPTINQNITTKTESKPNTTQSIMYINNVFYNLDNTISISCIDESGEEYIIDLFYYGEYNKYTFNIIKQEYKHKYIICDIDTQNTMTPKDDIIIDWNFIESEDN